MPRNGESRQIIPLSLFMHIIEPRLASLLKSEGNKLFYTGRFFTTNPLLSMGLDGPSKLQAYCLIGLSALSRFICGASSEQFKLFLDFDTLAFGLSIMKSALSRSSCSGGLSASF